MLKTISKGALVAGTHGKKSITTFTNGLSKLNLHLSQQLVDNDIIEHSK